MAYTPYCIEGFDKLGSIGELSMRGSWSLVTNDLVYSSTSGRNGLGCLTHNVTGSTAKRCRRLTLINRPDNVASSLTTLKVAFAFRVNFSSAPSTSQTFVLMSFWDSAASPVMHAYLRLHYTSGNWTIGYTTAGIINLVAYSIGPSLTSGRWYHVELEVSEFRSTAGAGNITCLCVDGTTPSFSTAANSASTGTSLPCRHIDINATSSSTNLASGESIDYDDFHCGSIGAVGTISNPNTNLLGNTRVDCLRPDGDGNYNTQFTPLSGTRWQAVDETDANDGDTTYVYASNVDDRLSVTVEDLPHSPTTIHCISPYHVARREGAGSRSSRSFLRVSGTDYESSTLFDLSHGTSYQGAWMFPGDSDCLINPATGVAYTKTNLQSIEIGVRVSV